MSRSELHDWEYAIESLCGDNADKMLAIAQDIYNTAFVRGKNQSESERTRWIPVSERLPEDDGYYLVTFQRDLLTRIEQYTSISEFRECSWTEFGRVVAWMQLPEGYKAESEEV